MTQNHSVLYIAIKVCRNPAVSQQLIDPGHSISNSQADTFIFIKMRLCALKTDQTAEPRAAPETVLNMRVTRSKFQPRPQTAVRVAGRSVASHTSVITTCLKSQRRLRNSRTQFAIDTARAWREREKDSKCVNSSAGDGAKKYGTHYGSDFAEDRDTNKQTHKSPNDETLGYLATCAPLKPFCNPNLYFLGTAAAPLCTPKSSIFASRLRSPG